MSALAEHLVAEWHPDLNGNLRPGDVTAGSGKKVWWLCHAGHEWQTRPWDRSRGKGCPFCSGKRVAVGENDLATTNPLLAAQWHPTKNETREPTHFSSGSSKSVWWLCDDGHSWHARIDLRTKGTGCPICSRSRQHSKNNIPLFNELLESEWHPNKNEGLSLSDFTKGSHKRVWWRCTNGHEWQAAIGSRNRGSSCPFCSRRKAWPGETDLVTLNPELAQEWHPTRNTGVDPTLVGPNSGQVVWWLCRKHPEHEWKATVVSRNKGNGCPGCFGHKVYPGLNDLASVNTYLAEEWHEKYNGTLKPSDVTKSSGRKVWWQCRKNPDHEWQATVGNRGANDSGCPKCHPPFSKAETELFEILRVTYPDAVQSDRKILGRYELDIWIPSLRVGVEFNGTYWHDETRTDHDNIGAYIRSKHDEKEKRAAAANVRLLVVWEADWTENPNAVIADVLALIASDETPPVRYTFARNR